MKTSRMSVASNKPGTIAFFGRQSCRHTLQCCVTHTYKFKTINIYSLDLSVCGLWFKQCQWAYIGTKCGSKVFRCCIGTCSFARQNFPSDLQMPAPNKQSMVSLPQMTSTNSCDLKSWFCSSLTAEPLITFWWPFFSCSGIFYFNHNKQRLKEITNIWKDKRQENYFEAHFIRCCKFCQTTFWAKLPRFLKWMFKTDNIENWNESSWNYSYHYICSLRIGLMQFILLWLHGERSEL